MTVKPSLIVPAVTVVAAGLTAYYFLTHHDRREALVSGAKGLLKRFGIGVIKPGNEPWRSTVPKPVPEIPMRGAY